MDTELIAPILLGVNTLILIISMFLIVRKRQPQFNDARILAKIEKLNQDLQKILDQIKPTTQTLTPSQLVYPDVNYQNYNLGV